VDYKDFREQLERIDEILCLSGLERNFVDQYIQLWLDDSIVQTQSGLLVWVAPTDKAISRQAKIAVQALRCNIARELLDESLRDFSVHLADSPLLQRFTCISRLDVIKVPTKSTLQRWEHLIPQEQIRNIVDLLTKEAASPSGPQGQALGLMEPINITDFYIDITCVKANIHFPVDWVMLRDATRTLMNATAVIRTHGLKHRMEDPFIFIKRINKLCIQMTHSRRKAEGKKERKKILRLMKKIIKIIRLHAQRHRDLLFHHWKKTDLKQGQVKQILERIDGVLKILPQVVKQAHERIIGERQVPNDQKILSLYEPNISVMVRGKAGEEVEFGNPLVLAESSEGLILDWALLAPEEQTSDADQLPKSLNRMKEGVGRYPNNVGSDRGFDSKKNRRLLETLDIYNGLCPKDPQQLLQRLQEPQFCHLQQRRSQTEGRIAIFKNCFLGRPLRSKGFLNRQISVSWAVLAHNLWVIARLQTSKQQDIQLQPAA
jgi:IS5 family transposase